LSQETLSLFSIPICLFDLNIDKEQQKTIENIIKNTEYRLTESGNAYISEDLHLFQTHPELHFLNQQFLKYINYFNEDVLNYKKTNFKITTSWSTQCLYGQESERHKHSNSMYSGVYYNKCDIKTSEIIFYNNDWTGSNYELEVDKYNSFNATRWRIQPRDKLLIIFPSFLSHKILKNLNKKIRHSIAFNCIPVPPYGFGDSFIID
jgi:uncharacterized protein (TIGR02466 family)